jgi:hypothetical protein
VPHTKSAFWSPLPRINGGRKATVEGTLTAPSNPVRDRLSLDLKFRPSDDLGTHLGNRLS